MTASAEENTVSSFCFSKQGTEMKAESTHHLKDLSPCLRIPSSLETTTGLQLEIKECSSSSVHNKALVICYCW